MSTAGVHQYTSRELTATNRPSTAEVCCRYGRGAAASVGRHGRSVQWQWGGAGYTVEEDAWGAASARISIKRSRAAVSSAITESSSSGIPATADGPSAAAGLGSLTTWATSDANAANDRFGNTLACAQRPLHPQERRRNCQRVARAPTSVVVACHWSLAGRTE
ncbi:hypothetical protein VaNZ11_017020 [Volvox africanus]|uniref:Uncharacterized protein n=1 Tax=Volvox africanus TaxID=51714 RepID=A0ABQ5SP07_9CHLO|nr:hypothetical protein VaNZ11_017020 [Volvox africanus]